MRASAATAQQIVDRPVYSGKPCEARSITQNGSTLEGAHHLDAAGVTLGGEIAGVQVPLLTSTKKQLTTPPHSPSADERTRSTKGQWSFLLVRCRVPSSDKGEFAWQP